MSFQLIDLFIEAGRYAEAKLQLDLLADRYRTDTGWQRRTNVVDTRLAGGHQPAQQAAPADFLIDRLLRELRSNPNQDDKRFRLVSELNRYDRHAEAYDHLQILAERHDKTEQWLRLFSETDQGFIKKTGTSPIFLLIVLPISCGTNPAMKPSGMPW